MKQCRTVRLPGFGASLYTVIVAGVWLLPLVSIAQAPVASAPSDGFSLKNLVDVFIQVIGGVLIPLAIALLFLVFVVSIIRYIAAAQSGSNNMIDLAKKRLLYPLIILFFVFTLWGIIEILRILFGS